MTVMTISGRRFDLSAPQVERALQGELPEPILEHFVVVLGRRWPPKQVLALATGLDRADFTSHQARRALTRLGFTAARASHHGHRRFGDSAASTPRDSRGDSARPSTLAEQLRPFIGQWVAIRGEEVLVGADSLPDVVAWLARHQQRAQSVFRVPDSERAIRGAAPQ